MWNLILVYTLTSSEKYWVKKNKNIPKVLRCDLLDTAMKQWQSCGINCIQPDLLFESDKWRVNEREKKRGRGKEQNYSLSVWQPERVKLLKAKNRTKSTFPNPSSEESQIPLHIFSNAFWQKCAVTMERNYKQMSPESDYLKTRRFLWIRDFKAIKARCLKRKAKSDSDEDLAVFLEVTPPDKNDVWLSKETKAKVHVKVLPATPVVSLEP